MPTDQLVAEAKKEGSVVVYTSNTSAQANAEAFEKQYGIKVQSYRADSEAVLQRALQESGAGKLPADVLDTNAGELIALAGKGVLADYTNQQVIGQLRQGAVRPGWVASRYDAFVLAWNTTKVASPPVSYESLADPKYQGQVAVESGDWDWYLALSSYLTGRAGWSQQQTEDFFRRLVANGKVVQGHTVQSQLLDSGQIAVTPDGYKHLVDADHDTKKAAVAWQPAVQPVILRPNGVGLARTAPHPAAAALYMNWSLTDGQTLLPAQFRVPSNLSVTTNNPIPAGVETYDIPLDEMTNNGAQWNQRWQALLRGAPSAGNR